MLFLNPLTLFTRSDKKSYLHFRQEICLSMLNTFRSRLHEPKKVFVMFPELVTVWSKSPKCQWWKANIIITLLGPLFSPFKQPCTFGKKIRCPQA